MHDDIKNGTKWFGATQGARHIGIEVDESISLVKKFMRHAHYDFHKVLK